MKLQTKITIALVAGIIGISLGAQVIQQLSLRRSMQTLVDENLQTVQKDQTDMVDNLRIASQPALLDFMLAGEMDRFRKMLEAQKQVAGLTEVGLTNYKGVITNSTVVANQKKSLSADLLSKLLVSDATVRQQTADSFEIYKPLPVTQACMECHSEFKGAKMGGILYYRFSSASFEEEKRQWAGFAEAVLSKSQLNSLVSTGVLVLSLAALIAYLIQRMVARPLLSASKTIDEGAEEVRQASETIASTSEELATGATEQAAATEEASASLEEMSGMTKRNTDDARQAKTMAGESNEVAKLGATAMREMTKTMTEIEAASSRVAGVLKSIDEIAFQTNILALNAAVEAARAGEAGAGFAIVAEEVRSLAQRSAEAARNTSQIVTDAVEKSRRGASLSKEVSSHLEHILEKTSAEDTIVAQIARASEEQSLGISQVTSAIQQVDKVTQRSAAIGEESASAAQELKKQAQALSEATKGLTKLLNG